MALVLEAMDLVFRHNLNASDALILGSALQVRREWLNKNAQMLVVTSDQRLARAAAAEQLQVFNPEQQDRQVLQALLGS